jgi:hypothetical protein
LVKNSRYSFHVLKSSQTETDTQSSDSSFDNDDGRRNPPPKNTRSYSTTGRGKVSRGIATGEPSRGGGPRDNNNGSTFKRRIYNNGQQRTGVGPRNTGVGPRNTGVGGPSLRLENPQKLSRLIPEQGNGGGSFNDRSNNNNDRRQQQQQQPRRAVASTDSRQQRPMGDTTAGECLFLF